PDRRTDGPPRGEAARRRDAGPRRRWLRLRLGQRRQRPRVADSAAGLTPLGWLRVFPRPAPISGRSLKPRAPSGASIGVPLEQTSSKEVTDENLLYLVGIGTRAFRQRRCLQRRRG